MTQASSPRAWVRFDAAVGSVICARVAAGESLSAVCEDQDLPCRATVKAWKARSPGFRAQLTAAYETCRANPRGGRPRVWRPAVGALICARIAEGMTMSEACDLPGLPCPTTVYGWVKSQPGFAADYALARTIQAHRRFDQVWELAQAATAETAAATRLRIDAAKWQAARMAPRLYGLRAEAAEPQDEAQLMNSVIITKFAARPGEPQWEEVSWPLRRPGPIRGPNPPRDVASQGGFPEDRGGPAP